MLILCPATLLNSWIRFNIFFVKYLWHSKYKSMLLANRVKFISFFLILSFFSCLIVLARISSIMLNRNGESGYTCVVPNRIGKAFKLSLLSKMLVSSDLVRYGVFCVEIYSFFAKFLNSFYLEWILNFFKWIFASIEMIMWLSSYGLLMCCITLTNLHVLNYSCIPGINSTQLWWMIAFTFCWIQFAVFYWGFLL